VCESKYLQPCWGLSCETWDWTWRRCQECRGNQCNSAPTYAWRGWVGANESWHTRYTTTAHTHIVYETCLCVYYIYVTCYIQMTWPIHMCDMMTLLLHHHSTYTHSAAVKSGRRCQVYTAPLSRTSEKSVQFSPCVRVACMSPGAHYTTVYMYGIYGTCRDCVAVCCSVLQCVWNNCRWASM